ERRRVPAQRVPRRRRRIPARAGRARPAQRRDAGRRASEPAAAHGAPPRLARLHGLGSDSPKDGHSYRGGGPPPRPHAGCVASSEIFWNGGAGYDIHVLAGETSPSLLDLLVIKEDTTPPRLSFASHPPADIASISFTPNFLSLAVPPRSGGVTVDTATGKV